MRICKLLKKDAGEERMPFVDFKCKICGHQEEIFFRQVLSKVPKEMFCPKCANACHQSIMVKLIGTPKIIINEGQGPISSKPSSYWRGAEKNRLNNIKRQQKEKREKEGDGDVKTIQQIKTQIRNAENTGQTNKAKALRKKHSKHL